MGDEGIRVETLNPEQAGKMIGKGAEFIRVGLQQKSFPFGNAVKTKSGQWNYLIIASKFYEYIGLNFKILNNTEEERERRYKL